MVENNDLLPRKKKNKEAKLKKSESEEELEEKYYDDFDSSSFVDESEEENENIDVDENIIEQIELPDNIRRFKPPSLKEKKSVHFDCSDEEGEDDEQEDDLIDAKSSHKAENLSKKRLVAVFMLFPIFFGGIIMVFEMFGKFKWEKTTMQFSALAFGAVIALFFLARVPLYRSILKLILCFAWVIFLLPTYQVYKCSPIELKNDMIGTWFSVKTEAFSFLESTYTTSNCFKSFTLHAPYALSFMSPKVVLKVEIDELISLKNETHTENEETDVHYFLLVSKRSVKQRFHKIYMLAVATSKEANLLESSLILSIEEKRKNVLMVSGSILNIDQIDLPLKEELETLKYLVRPIKLQIETVKYASRYSKLH